MQLEIAVLSRTGGRSHNEDACGFWTGEDICFCVVSDGAGGHRGGDVASKVVVHEALSCCRELNECNGRAIGRALAVANEALVREQRSTSEFPDMRATAVILAIDFARAFAVWGHLGDSRLYCFRQGHIVVQTKDHSVVQTMLDAGLLSDADLRSSPQRNKLLSAMGDTDDFEPRLQDELFPVAAHDKFLLCTDGLWEYVDERELIETLSLATSAEDWLRVLEERVLEHGREGQDNYSALAVWVQ
jgi:PPM family protein phosphatase